MEYLRSFPEKGVRLLVVESDVGGGETAEVGGVM